MYKKRIEAIENSMGYAKYFNEYIETTNYYARMSCTRWNKTNWQPKSKLGKKIKANFIDKAHQFSRDHYREKYRAVAKSCWETREHQYLMDLARLGSIVNTYPMPYNDLRFANWDESKTIDDYSIITDQSGCPVKHSTSYCAWKIFEATGRWPQRKTPIRLDADNWLAFLSEAGFDDIVDSPDPNYHFVGINQDDGEWGITVWYERTDESGDVKVSTYRDKTYSYETIFKEEVRKYIWIRIN